MNDGESKGPAGRYTDRRRGVSRGRVGDLRVRLHDLARRGLEGLFRSSLASRAATAWVERSLARATRRLRAHPQVEEVWLRGSHGGPAFQPLLSDVDLAIRIRGTGHPAFDEVVSLLDALRHVRRWDPSIRDEWQLLAGGPEWDVLERFAGLLEMDRWRSLDGRAATRASPPPPLRLRLAHDWRRVDQWTEAGLRAVFPGPGRRPDGVLFAACEKKVRALASRITGEPAPTRRDRAPRSPSDALDRAAALLGVREKTARHVFAAIGRPALPPLPSVVAHPIDRPFLEAASRLESLADVEAACFLAGTPTFVLRDDGGAETGRAHRDWVRLVEETSTTDCGRGRGGFPTSRAVLSLQGSLEPIRFVRADSDDERGSEWRPLLLREQLLSAALFAAAHVRVLADRGFDGPLPATTSQLARSLVFFREDRVVRDGAEAVERLGIAGAPAPSEGPSRWYAFNLALVDALMDVLRTEPLDGPDLAS